LGLASKIISKELKKTLRDKKKGCIFAPALGDRENESECKRIRHFKVLAKRIKRS